MKQSKGTQDKRNHIWPAVPVIFVLIIFAAVLFMKAASTKEENVLEQIREKNGYIRTISSEEYEFFKKLAVRDNPDKLTEEELEALTKEKINRANAEFMLANQMDLCGPYSFESFQRDLENENAQRKLKKERNEVFYGLESFDLITYYLYISGNLKLDMVSFVTEHMDSAMMKEAEKYFNEYREKYRTIEKIEYLLTEEDVTEEKNLSREEMSTLEKTDSVLFEFLYYGKENDFMEYFYNDHQRSVRIKTVKYEKLTFKNNIERVVRDYITNVYLENWIQELEEKYPVEFNLS